MLKNLKFIVLAAFACTLFFSCAEEVEETNASIQKRILEAYLEVNYPDKDYTITKSGLVILDHKPGTGEMPDNREAVYMNHSVKYLDGNYQSTDIKEVAQRIGTYKDTAYYGPRIMEIGYGKITDGVHEALLMMREGAEMTIIVPPYLSSKDNPGNYGYGYTSDKQETSQLNLIYELKMGDVIRSIVSYQKDSLESFRDINYPGVDSSANGFYFKKLVETANDSIPVGEKADVWYVGKLLDGFVFDTNIEDTAKKYGIYNPATNYKPLSVIYKDTYKVMSEEEGGAYVSGFAKALKNMTYGERAVTFFGYDWGYGANDKGSIPAYSMLFFDIYIEKKSAE